MANGALRASATGELVFDNVKVPKENIFPNVKGLKGPLGCLTKARYGIAWGAIGAAMDCYDTALRYSKERDTVWTDRSAAFNCSKKNWLK